MLGQLLLTAILAASVRLASSQSTDCSSLTCTTSGGHIIVTRESDAPSGTSAMNVIALGVTNQCPGSDIAETPYPAELDPYVSSEQEGVGNLTELVLEYQSCCPDSKIVLMGYSQVRNVSPSLYIYIYIWQRLLTPLLIMTWTLIMYLENAGRPSDGRLSLRDDRDGVPDNGGVCFQCDSQP